MKRAKKRIPRSRKRLLEDCYMASVSVAEAVGILELGSPGLRVCAISMAQAEEFLEDHGRHYKSPAEPICAIGVGDQEGLHGAAVLGRNASGDGELSHIYVDGISQGYSLLYGACWRALKALGYEKAVL